jgi:mannose-6-phosphate isomerase-like protein (cupin superfamily)
MVAPKTYKDIRPWGEELWLMDGINVPGMAKVISVNPGEALSLQYHNERDEHWFIVSGDGVAVIGDEKIPLTKGSVCYIPRKINHRVIGGKNILVFVELAYGDFDEKDIVRLEDKYGRTAENK